MRRPSIRRKCVHCKKLFTVGFKKYSQLYCRDECRTAACNSRCRLQQSHWLNKKRRCRFCGKWFSMSPKKGHNTQHCSLKCSLKSIQRSTNRFHKMNPMKMREYNRVRWKKYGNDTLIVRLRRKYPDLPNICEAKGCGEDRVLQASHKPRYKRNGKNRTMSLYKRHMFWMLCPTCHVLIDKKICTPSEFHLK